MYGCKFALVAETPALATVVADVIIAVPEADVLLSIALPVPIVTELPAVAVATSGTTWVCPASVDVVVAVWV